MPSAGRRARRRVPRRQPRPAQGSRAEKRELATRTADTPLWEGAFVQPRNTKVFANFAETRTYRFDRDGRSTRRCTYGYDLASVEALPVPAANTGTVVFAAPLSIYGNTVIVDHGCGLRRSTGTSRRSTVKDGDTVTKEQVLGRTGTTGLAIGDHLHYEVLVHGISVTPLEWWDGRWIRDHIGKPLREANLPATLAGPAAADDDRAPARKRAAPASRSAAPSSGGAATGRGRAPGRGLPPAGS